MVSKEADIVISGQQLTFAQSMTVRVAIESFAGEIYDNSDYGDIGELYLKRIKEIRALILQTVK